jgi:hypothetical protein
VFANARAPEGLALRIMSFEDHSIIYDLHEDSVAIRMP